MHKRLALCHNIGFTYGDFGFAYDAAIYRHIAKEVVSGTTAVLNNGSLPMHYQEIFAQAADLYAILMIGASILDEHDGYSPEEIQGAIPVAQHVYSVAKKYNCSLIKGYSRETLSELVDILYYFAEGGVARRSYPAEYIRNINNFFYGLWGVLNKECERTGIFISPCCLASAPEMLQ